MKKGILLTMLLMLIGVSSKAQSISINQMDERFNDNKLPYGWFTEGWKVDSTGVVKKGGGFDLSELLGSLGNNQPEEDNPEENPENPEEKTENDSTKNQTPSIDISKLMGGGSSYNYLMTPPLSVQSGEALVFSAKKGGKDALSSFMSSDSGDEDSTFVVERAVYGEHMWIKVADFTTELDSTFKTFTISATDPGEYRFRFRAGGSVEIDSVAGFHIDSEAPDIYPIYQDKNIQPIDLCVCTEDTTMTFNIINTATGTLTVNLSAEGAYSLDNSQVSIAYADTAKVNLTFNYGQAHEGRNSTMLTFKTTDERVEEIPLPIDAIVSQAGVWMDDFNDNKLPYGWFTEGWKVDSTGVATIKQSSDDGGMGGMFGGGSSATYYLMTPPLTVSDVNDVLLFSVKKPGGGGGGFDMSSLMGGGGSSESTFFVEKSVYGSGKWERAKDFSNALDTVFTTQWLSGLEPGEYRFRFLASDSVVIDSVAGFQIDKEAPDLYVTLDSAVVRSLDLGMLRGDSTTTFTMINTGTGTLKLGVSPLDATRLAVNNANPAIASGDSLLLDATMLRDDERQGEIRELLMFVPEDERVSPQAVAMNAYIIKSDSWAEDFEPIYVIEDQTFPRRFPEGWETTGWILTEGGGDDMMAMFGGGGNEEKSWVAKTESKEYEVITPRLQAKQGHLLRFTADMGGGFMQMFSMFGLGGGDPSYLNLYYKRDYDKDWTLYNTYFQSDTVVFKAPYSGFYRLKFQGSGVSLDDFLGFSLPKDSISFGDFGMPARVLEEYGGQILNVMMDRTISAEDNDDGTQTPVACTVSLPYDFDIDEYYEPGTAQIYQLAYIDTLYNQFIFKELPDHKMEAWKPYMMIVNHGDVRLSVIDALFTAEVPEGSPVYDFYDWYWNGNYSEVGKWESAYRAFSLDDEQHVFSLTDIGTWEYVPVFQLYNSPRAFSFRGVLATKNLGYFWNLAYRQNPEVVEFKHEEETYEVRSLATRFCQPDVADSGDVTEKPDLLYIGDYKGSGTTGIVPTIRTIDRDGTQQLFDLQGRKLSEKPGKGIIIENGKKRVVR